MTTTETDSDTELDEPQREWINGLRDMCAFLETRPELINIYLGLTLNQFAEDKAEFAVMARSLGAADKVSAANYYTHTRRFGPHTVDINIGSKVMCERVKTGTKQVSTMVPPEGVELVEVVTDEPVYEWKCPASALQT